MESVLYNQEGKEAGKVTLPESIFGISWNPDLVHQVVNTMMSNKRTNTAKAKGRAEVRGGGRKPWQQKGLGKARHGSIRSPIWVGGGVAHGPKNERVFSGKISKSMKTAALFSILSRKFKDGEIFFLDKINLPEVKTREASKIISKLSEIKGLSQLNSKKKVVQFAVDGTGKDVEKSFRNLPSSEVENISNMNPLSALKNKYIVMVEPEKIFKTLTQRAVKKIFKAKAK